MESTTCDLTRYQNKQLVDIFNRYSARSVRRFADRRAALERTARLLVVRLKARRDNGGFGYGLEAPGGCTWNDHDGVPALVTVGVKKVAEKVAPRTGKKTSGPRRRGIGDTARKLIRAGLSGQAVVDGVLAEHPESSINLKHVAWYRCQMKKAGEL